MKTIITLSLPWRVIMLSILLLTFFSCDDEVSSRPINEVDYFPLHVGDSKIVEEWGTPYTITTDTIEVIDGKEYYRVTGSPVIDTYYFRKTEDGKVYEKYFRDEPEYLRFDFNVEVGTQWVEPLLHQALGGDWVVTLRSKNETVEVGNCTFVGCYYFFYDRPGWFDDEHHIWIAPNVGIVKEHYYWGNKTDLVESHIDGHSFSCK